MKNLDLVRKYNITQNEVDYESLLTVGNHHIAFNCDVTGFQTFLKEYAEQSNPITTMSHKAWSSYPDQANYTFEDLTFDTYEKEDGRVFRYPVLSEPKHHKLDGSKENILTDEAAIQHNMKVYTALRENQHRKNIFSIQLLIHGKVPNVRDVQNISQTLDLSKGKIYSTYSIADYDFSVVTFVHPTKNEIHFEVNSPAFEDGIATLLVREYASSHRITACNYEKVTRESILRPNSTTFNLAIDEEVQIHFYKENTVTHEVETYFESLWQQALIPNLMEQANFAQRTTEEVAEVERRMILSIYNLLLNSTGNQPAQETGLMCNSWYGKFHLEMHLWHSCWAPKFGFSEHLESTLEWYFTHVDKAIENASRNGFKGYRWPKMIDLRGDDSPSIIAPLLIWQQSHFIFLAHLLFKENKMNNHSQAEYWDLLKGTADFMVDFLEFDTQTNTYHINGPIQCAQEEFVPMSIKNPTFELAYWKHCFKLVAEMGAEFGQDVAIYLEMAEKMEIPQPVDGLYPSHENAPDTFPNFMKDHPMQLGILGMFENPDADKVALLQTLKRVLSDWDEASMWGWDYGYMSMLAHHLGETDLAIDILLKVCPKNYYAKNGHNYQKGRQDLPQYLPGNGALLWAIHEICTVKIGAEKELKVNV